VDTPLVKGWREDMTPEERAQREAVVAQMPLIQPEEVAEAVLEFIRDDSLAGEAMGIMYGRPHRLVPAVVTLHDDPAQRVPG